MAAVARFQSGTVPRQQGEFARVRVVAGPDLGVTFVLLGPAAVIGRGEGADIFISDLKASRKHAEVLLTQAGWGVRDLGSANGIFMRNKTLKSAGLVDGEAFTVGGTTFEFFSAQAGTKAIAVPPRPPLPPERREALQLSREERLQKITAFGGGLLDQKNALSGPVGGVGNPNRRRLIMYGGMILGVLVLFMGDEEAPKKKSDKKSLVRELAAIEASPVLSETQKTAEKFFKAGFREYREGNYLRARQQFETSLQIDPQNSLAKVYAENCRLGIEKQVSEHLNRGRRAAVSGRYSSAVGHFQAVLRLLKRDPANPLAVEAKSQLETLQKKGRG